MKIRIGDTVKIIAGKDRSKTGKVLSLFKDKDLVLVEGINMVKKHMKAQGKDDKGGIISVERPLHVSNVAFVDPKDGGVTKVGYKIVKSKKYRISKKSGETL